MDRKLQRHRADSLRQHGFLVLIQFVVSDFFCKSGLLHICRIFSENIRTNTRVSYQRFVRTWIHWMSLKPGRCGVFVSVSVECQMSSLSAVSDYMKFTQHLLLLGVSH